MDLTSAIMVPLAKLFWGFISMCLMCTGLGGALAGVALVYGGVWMLPWLAVWLPGCAFLVWIAEPIRHRYLRWVRVDHES